MVPVSRSIGNTTYKVPVILSLVSMQCYKPQVTITHSYFGNTWIDMDLWLLQSVQSFCCDICCKYHGMLNVLRSPIEINHRRLLVNWKKVAVCLTQWMCSPRDSQDSLLDLGAFQKHSYFINHSSTHTTFNIRAPPLETARCWTSRCVWAQSVSSQQVSVTAREDVPPFGPPLPNPAVFRKVREGDGDGVEGTRDKMGKICMVMMLLWDCDEQTS